MNPRDGMRRAAEILVERGVMPLFAGVKGSTVYELPGTHADLDLLQQRSAGWV